MTKTKKLRVLREIYAAIPSPGCKGLCVDQCTTVPVFSFELEQLEKATSRKLPTMSAGDARVRALRRLRAPPADLPCLWLGRGAALPAWLSPCRAGYQGRAVRSLREGLGAVRGKFCRGGQWPEETCEVCGCDPRNTVHVASNPEWEQG